MKVKENIFFYSVPSEKSFTVLLLIARGSESAWVARCGKERTGEFSVGKTWM